MQIILQHQGRWALDGEGWIHPPWHYYSRFASRECACCSYRKIPCSVHTFSSHPLSFAELIRVASSNEASMFSNLIAITVRQREDSVEHCTSASPYFLTCVSNSAGASAVGVSGVSAVGVL